MARPLLEPSPVFAKPDDWQPLTPEVIAALPESPAVFEVSNLVRTVLFIDRAHGKLRERLTTLWQDPMKLPVRPGGHYFRYELTAREEEALQKHLATYRKHHRGTLPPINHEAEQRTPGTVTPIRRDAEKRVRAVERPASAVAFSTVPAQV